MGERNCGEGNCGEGNWGEGNWGETWSDWLGKLLGVEDRMGSGIADEEVEGGTADEVAVDSFIGSTSVSFFMERIYQSNPSSQWLVFANVGSYSLRDDGMESPLLWYIHWHRW
jgi:hypothetical protein